MPCTFPSARAVGTTGNLSFHGSAGGNPTGSRVVASILFPDELLEYENANLLCRQD